MRLDIPYETTNNVGDWRLTPKWGKTLDIITKYTDKLIDDCFFNIRVKLMLKVLNQISKENRLSKYDEKIFEYFHHLMRYYYQTINLYEENKETITNSKAKEIIEGICTVLSSQVNQFEENQQQEYIYYHKRSAKNPIIIEKEKIMSSTKQLIIQAISDIQQRYMKSQKEICYTYTIIEVLKSTNSHDCYLKILEDMYMCIISSCSEELYKIYIESTKSSIEKTNTLQFRKAANFYYESIKQEKENLEMIIKVQVNALENELEHMDIELSEHQKIRQILDTLIEAYQHLGKEIEALATYFKEVESRVKKIDLLNEDKFTEYIIYEGSKKYIADLASKNFPNDIGIFNNNIVNSKIEFEQKLTNYINEVIDYKMVCHIKNNDMNNFISEKSTMIDEFLDCFKSIKEYYESNTEQLLSTDYADVFKGIYETIEIKLESIIENKTIFIETIENNSSILKYDIAQKDKEIIVNTMLSYWYKKLPLISKQLIETIEELYTQIQQNEIILKEMAILDKQKQQYQEYLNKKYLQFLKEQLLFELTTYEEILNYSVCRLREEESDIIKNFVEVMDSINIKIDELLKKYNIYTIKPQKYDYFDGKEHEVLMAEKHEGFEKGQIIKLMNTGYKYNNIVIIRANVIAAK